MLSRLVGFSLSNRLIILVFSGLLILFGLLTAFSAPIDVFPEFTPPQVTIQTEAPGFSSSEVESLVTIPLEQALNGAPGLVTLRCDIHEHMRGLILVLATPHFAVTDESGHFRLSGLPAGRYTLKAWIDSRTTREHPVDLSSGSTLHVDFP